MSVIRFILLILPGYNTLIETHLITRSASPAGYPRLNAYIWRGRCYLVAPRMATRLRIFSLVRISAVLTSPFLKDEMS